MTIFFSAGEPSGDVHGANLIRRLREIQPGVKCVGYGGPEMAAAGCQLQADLTALAVMWFLRALVNLHKFLALASRADRYFRHERPDAVVLIDYPGFNWWIARRAKAHGIPVYYYCPPQIWAWASWRIKKMRRYVDHVLCALPFEAEWFREQGCRATFVGHPFFDEVRRQPLDQDFIDQQNRQRGQLVAILPGSRTQEVSHNLHWFLKAARLVHARVPQARFAIAAFKPRHVEMARQLIARSNLPVDVHLRKTAELIHSATCCMACSGSVSLELLFHAKPTVILYWISPLAFWVQSFFVRVKYITLVNLLAAKRIFLRDDHSGDPLPDAALFPEYLTSEDKSEDIAEQVIGWLTDSRFRDETVSKLIELRRQVGHAGASATAARLILQELTAGKPDSHAVHLPRPHFLPGMKVSSSV
jgi:lipid-A-disaccharide synthase